MPRTLTLEEVKKAGREARWFGDDTVIVYHPDCDTEDCGFCFVEECIKCGVVIDTLEFSDWPSKLAEDWYHMPGCDCEFCTTGNVRLGSE